MLKNQILHTTFTLEELKGKKGLFIIEMTGNGTISRCVIKKGHLSLIHRATEAGHVAFIIDENHQICKSPSTGVWMKNEMYSCDEKSGTIYIPYSSSKQNNQIILIHDGFA